MKNNIIFTCYFTMYKNPQGKIWRKNKITFVQPLYNSVKQLKLNMIIFYDQLDRRFISKYSTDKIRFEKYNHEHKVPNMSRFYCYLNHLQTNNYEKILCLDCGDLELYKDPFPLIDDSILIGSENGKIKDSIWIKDVFRKAYGRMYYDDNQILNCGILGGKQDILTKLLTFFKDDTPDMNINVDMAIFNRLIYDRFDFKTGHPIHTVFNKFEGKESGCYIRHK